MSKKKIKETVTIAVQQPETFWNKVKGWFYHSESVALSYITMITGAITGMVGYFDFSPLWRFLSTGTEFTTKQLMGIGAAVVGGGIAMYIARVRGTKEVAGRLLPTADK